MAYFNLLQCYAEYEIDNLDNDLISITYDSSRFTEYTDEPIRLKFKELTEESFLILRNFPCIICFENFKDFIAIAELQNVQLDKSRKTITATLKLISEKIQVTSYSKMTKFVNICDLDKLEEALNFDGWEKTRTHWAIKKSDLFKNLAPLNIFENLETLKSIFPNQNIDILNPPQIIGQLDATVSTGFSVEATTTTPPDISDVPSFINKVIDINKAINKDENHEVFYRGHGKFSYELLPTLLREDPNGKGKVYLEGEHLLFRELLTTEPLSFSNDISGFDILTRMQHYGMPTRMLDISSNPLTALYFACENLKHDEDGEVILISIKKSNICFYDSDKISCLTNLAKLTATQKDELAKYIVKSQKNDPTKELLNETDFTEEFKVYEQYLHCILNEKPYFKPRIEIKDLKNIFCVKGRLNQERIIAQSGSFLIFGLDAEAIPKNGNTNFTVHKIRIKKENKKTILDELDLLNINQRTVYPSMENSAKYIKNRLENFRI
jgi:hypothetical protein